MSVENSLQRNLAEHTERLNSFTNALRGLAKSIVALLSLEFVLVPLLALETTIQWTISARFGDLTSIIYGMVVAVGLLALRSLFRFNTYRRDGYAVYYRIADIVDWENRNKRFLVQSTAEVRDSMGQFIRSSSLPFSSSDNGRIIYVLIFAILLSSASVIFVLSY